MKRPTPKQLTVWAKRPPRIVGIYLGGEGWTKPLEKIRLTPEGVTHLKRFGLTRLRVRWGFRTWEMSSQRYLSHHEPRNKSTRRRDAAREQGADAA